jgi:hypothetical protein
MQPDHDPASRADPIAYWQRRATAYRELVEAMQNLLVTTPTIIKRIAVVRVQYNQRGFLGNEADIHCRAGQLRGMKRAAVKFSVVRRLWMVCQLTPNGLGSTHDNLQAWDHLIMAKAHKAGRDFHYAKYLMTEESERWTYEHTN